LYETCCSSVVFVALRSPKFVDILQKIADIGYQVIDPEDFWNFRPNEFKKSSMLLV